MVQTSLRIGEYEAWVEIERQKIEHYAIHVDEKTNVVTCWIASTAGKHFGVGIAKSHSRFHCKVDLYADGSRLKGCHFNTKPKFMEGASAGEYSVRPFIFGVLNLTDDESLLRTQSYEQLGTIKVVMNRITNYTKHRVVSTIDHIMEIPESKIHERAKKSVTHHVSLGEAKPAHKRVLATYSRQELVATFIFHYRSLDMLTACGIVPRNPSPAETEGSLESGPIPRKRMAEMTEDEEEGDKPIVDIDDSEDEDKRQEAQLEAELERIRRARLERQDKRATKKIKCEPKPIFVPGEIIDLTI